LAWPTVSHPFTRDAPSSPLVHLHLVLNATADPTSSDFYKRHAVIRITGTDYNGVIASAYVVVTVVA